MTAGDRSRTGVRLPSLTSLRWFAATLVFLGHGTPLVAGTPLEGAYRNIAVQGGTGVSFFFILSGFVLAWAHSRGDTARAFYRRRVARIVPAYLVAWGLSWLVYIGVDHIHDPASLAKGFVALTGLHAWVPEARVYYGTNGVSWSLSAEAFFYALFPVLIVFVSALRQRTVWALLTTAIGVSLAIPLGWQPRADHDLSYWAIYINPSYRLLEFVIGISISRLIQTGVRLHIPPAAAVALAIGGYLLAGHVPLYAMWVATTLIPFAIVIFACAEADLSGARTGLRRPTLIRLGQWSFAFYLIHQLLLRTTVKLVDLASSSAWHLGVLIGTYAIAIAASYLLFHFIERPFELRIRHGSTATPQAELSAHAPAVGSDEYARSSA